MNHPVRTCLTLLIAGGLVVTSPAQETPIPAAPEAAERSPDDLDDLLGPIALYPDDLIAIILPAAARPTDIVLAARYLEKTGSTDKVDEQAWDESVRGLAHFPDVIEWMNNNLAWTQEVGDAFALQPADVMKSIQRLRGKAYAAGTLRDSEQQKILVDGNVIRIVSAEEDVIHVPSYSSEVVYVDHPVYSSAPWITFGIGWAIGSWHHWSCDWYGYNVWVFDHHDHWHDHNHHYYHGNPYYYGHYYQHGYHHDHGHAWCPPKSYAHYHYRGGDNNGYHNRTNNRPGPYVENESLRRSWNGGNNRNGNNSNRSEDVTGNGRANGGNNNDSTRGERSARGPRSNRGTTDANPNPGVVANDGGTPNNGTAPVVSDSGGRNGRTRDNSFNRGNSNVGSSGDSSRRPRTSPPVNPTVPAVVATPDSAPPVVTSSRSRQNRAPAETNGRAEYARRSRQESRADSGVNRTVQAYAPERTDSTSTSSSNAESRSNTSRSSASSVRRYNDSSNRSSTPTTTSSSSSSNHNHGSSNSGRSTSSSSDSGRSQGSDSGRSSNSGGGNGGGRSSGNAGSGRGR